MRKFTVTVNGQDYDVVVKDGGAAAAAAAVADATRVCADPGVACRQHAVIAFNAIHGFGKR